MALSDKQAREIIVNKLNKNIFVIAGAGSGKTSILITRMVRMVEEGFDIKSFAQSLLPLMLPQNFVARFRSILLKRSQQTEEQHKLEKIHSYLHQPIFLELDALMRSRMLIWLLWAQSTHFAKNSSLSTHLRQKFQLLPLSYLKKI